MKEFENSSTQLQELYEMISSIENNMKCINKNSKKSIMSIESLKEELIVNKEQNFKLKRELEEKKFQEVKIYKKILILLDQIDLLFGLAKRTENKELLECLVMIRKIIEKEMVEIKLVEIRARGSLFNSEIHKCIGVEESKQYEDNEIISVIKRGYTLDGKVLRPATVIISKKKKEEK